MAFQKATKRKAKGRMAIDGPSGSGKTFTALRVAQSLAPTGKIAVIDTERGSASKYADLFSFDVCELENFHPDQYIQAIHDAESSGYEVIVIDSLSHAWEGTGGILELNDKAAAKVRGNSYAAWRETTPIHNSLINAMLQSSCHVIATMRTKTEYILEEVNGKKVPKKIGMAPVQRAGMEYEFDLVVDMDLEHRGVITKTRCHTLSGEVFKNPGEDDLGATFAAWLTDGTDAPVSKQDLNRLQRAVIDRIAELGVDATPAEVGGAVVGAMGFASSGEIPANRLGEALEIAANWEPPASAPEEETAA